VVYGVPIVVSRTFTVRNEGGATLTLGAVTVPTGFTLTEGLSASLAAGASDTFTVQLDTTTMGTKSGEISFSNSDSDENPFVFRITGEVLPPPDVAVWCNGIEIADGDMTPDLADGTDFGTAIQGGLPAVQTFVIRAGWDGVPADLTVTAPSGFAMGPVYDWPDEGFGTGTHIFWVRLDTSVPGIKEERSLPNPHLTRTFNFRIRGSRRTSAPAPAEQFTGWDS
jgi:hypothetical protein